MEILDIKTKPSLFHLMFEVVQENCTGCGNCLTRCPTNALSFLKVQEGESDKAKKKARIDPGACVSCGFCMLECSNGAIIITVRNEPLDFYMEPASEDEKVQADKLCRKAKLHPEESICNCVFTKAKHVALAVLRGAKTTAELTIKTGVRSSGCSIHCVLPMQRLLKAHGIEIDDKYQIDTTLWDISDEVAGKYAEFRVAEDKEKFKDGIITDTMNKVFLGEPYKNIK